MNKIKVYLSARISEDAHEWNSLVCDSLKYPISVFMPQKHNPWNLEHKKFPKEVYNLDLVAMKEADICLVLPPYGRDCAWEIGWFSNSNKPTVVFVEKETEWLRDWMIKGGIDYIVTTNLATLKILKEDKILRYKKVIFLEKLEKLSEFLISIYLGGNKK